MYEEEKKHVIETGIKLHEYKLISLSGGNVSLRIEDHVLVTPSGMMYEDLVPDDIVVLDLHGNIIEGERRPSVDSIAILHILNHMPEVRAVIHTHQVYATAVGLFSDTLPAVVTTLVNATLGPVSVAPFSSAASLDMGVAAVEYLNGKRAVILKQHGIITIGGNLKEALYAAVYMEDAAKTYCVARSIRAVPELTPSQIQDAVDSFMNYGQITQPKK
ncbi:MAG: class II aldolase/adducin family protein [Sphaerochaetaceae bacterium]|jgi:L-ribulose-5-phosphate 4-epimerase|nr:class II aldolase/adducin family protein [Sphaerochaetaceae bacterium]NLO61371.1 class II aldolase/adducin family protein [Spirochaetales bacterium]MDD2405121.1 class II aldolase/adducin family protein [Sphaerochaetaceae bacterium]MDD3671464.1 class II aldolase/adducin family protein [Sphaerochaetaceae bacterium]MDD4258927.1 class II aldolase/adducin family protein [Sphaerochaetaceae bacterium]